MARSTVWWTFPSTSMTPARILVPPTSTPITRFAFIFGG